MAQFCASHRTSLAIIAVALAALAGSVAAESTTAADDHPDLDAAAKAGTLGVSAVSPVASHDAATEETALAPSSPRVGDAFLKGQLDLSRAVLSDNHFEVDVGEGRRAILTLDPQLQRAAEDTLGRAKAPFGAIVVLAPDGRILALAGRRNRAPAKRHDYSLPVTVWGPAASVFKIVTAAALVDGGLSPTKQVCYHGGLRSVDASQLEDHPKRDNRCGDLIYGIAKSQNALIAKLAHKHLSPARLRSVASTLGFGSAPSFALEVEPNRADIPDEPLEFARVAAGFWHTELSPLGGALLANVIASGGRSVTPRIVEKVVDSKGRTQLVESVPPKRALSEKVAASVRRAMIATTERGTARKGFRDRRGRKYLSDIQVAGKTGTLTKGSAQRKDSYVQYSWFVGFAPADAPKVTIAVLLGNPPKWHLKAHTAARLVLAKAL